MYNKNVRYSKSGYKLEWNPMTLILGIKCKDGFVIGADSKSIEGDNYNPIKMLNCEKISKLQNHNCLIGIAGNGHYAKRIIDKLNKETKKNIKEVDEFNRKFTEIIREIYNEDFRDDYMKFRDGFNSVEQNKDIVNAMAQIVYNKINFNIGFELIYGVLYKSSNKLNISLNKISSSDRYLTPVEPYWSIGSGSIFARYILNHIWNSHIAISRAINIAIYVIEQVKIISDDVGGQTRIAISTSQKTDFLSNEQVNEIALKLENDDKKSLDFLKKIYYE